MHVKLQGAKNRKTMKPWGCLSYECLRKRKNSRITFRKILPHAAGKKKITQTFVNGFFSSLNIGSPPEQVFQYTIYAFGFTLFLK